MMSSCVMALLTHCRSSWRRVIRPSILRSCCDFLLSKLAGDALAEKPGSTTVAHKENTVPKINVIGLTFMTPPRGEILT